ncbi:hypothetical protein DIPPA_28035 [Diplonema papillatum]|nr:hypothetical protein DIPPA_28035 [Diplonema papillatum]
MVSTTRAVAVLALCVAPGVYGSPCQDMEATWYDSATGSGIQVWEDGCTLYSPYGQLSVSVSDSSVSALTGDWAAAGVTGVLTGWTFIAWSNGNTWSQAWNTPAPGASPTRAPATPVPRTPAPSTNAPHTRIPTTPPPATPAPNTAAPPTNAPLTAAPETAVPVALPAATPTPWANCDTLEAVWYDSGRSGGIQVWEDGCTLYSPYGQARVTGQSVAALTGDWAATGVTGALDDLRTVFTWSNGITWSRAWGTDAPNGAPPTQPPVVLATEPPARVTSAPTTDSPDTMVPIAPTTGAPPTPPGTTIPPASPSGPFQTPVSPSIPAETNPPPTISRYSERVDLLVAPHPGDAVMTTQTSCPWDGSGLSAWETVVGASSGTVTLPANTRVLLSASSLAAGARFEKIEVPATSALVFADEEISFSVKAFVVAGELLIGSPTCRVEGPIRITFFGSKSDGDTPLNGYGTKGFAGLPGSKVDIFGRRFYPTWSRLARIVRAGADRAYLQEAVNWYPGQEILLTTTIPDDTDLGQPNQNEVRVIRAVSADGKVVQFTEPATYTHYAGAEYQGEVALLSRHVMLEGEPDADGFGGHLLVAGSNSRARIAGVATRYMGQTNVMARYPLHMHLMENQPDSYFSDNTMRDTYFRCLVIHGTHRTLATENVAFNATGNCYYIEDGVEEDNTVSHNLAAYVKTIGKPAEGSAQGGEQFYEAVNPGGLTSGDTVQPADHSAAGFYFSNAYNRIIGNVASGGWSGFGFPGLPKPIGVYASKTDLEPQGRPLLEFRGNVVHSSGWYWGSGGCIYIGGQLTTESDGTLAYNSGRFSRHTRVEKEPGIADWEGTPVVQVFENTLLYGCNKGVLHWGNRVEIVTAEMHDVARAGTLFGEVWLTDAIVNGASGNVGAGFASKHHDGFQFYDVSVKSVVTNIEFRNYRRSDCRGVAIPGTTDWVQSDETCGVDGNVFIHNNAIWSGLYHSDEYKPEHISAVNKITYTNVDTDLVISFKRARNGASRMFNFIDFDGSATLEGRPTIVGSDVDFWNVCDDCRFSSDWQVWLCPKAPPGIPERHIAHIKVLTPDITPANGGVGQWFGGCTTFVDGTDYSACNVGHVALWGHGPRFGDAKRSMIITSNAGITGITGTGWWMWFDGGAPKKWQVRPAQVPAGSVVRLATNYPSGTTFAVRTWYLYNGEHNNDLTLAASLDDLWANPREKYYFDGTTLYLVPMMPVSLTNGYYEKGGARVYDVDNAFIIEAVADCAADSRGFCTVKPLDTVPSSTEACPARPTAAPGTAAPAAAQTGAPASAAPRTAAPATAAPSTAAPATAAPGTSAPGTGAPGTTAPATPAPGTAAPGTSAPGAPVTTAPATSAPMTTAPDTVAPGTPVTTAPATPAPGTAAPITAAPAPATSAPVTDAPDTVPPGAPVTTAPATSAPATDAPSGVVNSTEAPVPSPEESDEEARTACLSLSEGASCGSAGEGKQCLSGVCRATERADEPGGGGGVESWVVPVLVAAGLAVLAACAAAGYTLAQKPKEIGFNEFMERIENASSSYSPALSPAATPTAMSPSETRSPMKFQV